MITNERTISYKPKNINICCATMKEFTENFYDYLYKFEQKYWCVYNRYCYNSYDYHFEMECLVYSINGYANRLFHNVSSSLDFLFPCLKPLNSKMMEKRTRAGYLFNYGISKMKETSILNESEYKNLQAFLNARNDSIHGAEITFKDYIFINRNLIFELISAISKLLFSHVNYCEFEYLQNHNNLFSYEHAIHRFFNSSSQIEYEADDLNKYVVANF